MTYKDLSPSQAKIIKIGKLSKNKLLAFDDIDKILLEEKENQYEKKSFNKFCICKTPSCKISIKF